MRAAEEYHPETGSRNLLGSGPLKTTAHRALRRPGPLCAIAVLVTLIWSVGHCLAQDSFESDDTWRDAGWISTDGTTQSRTIHIPTDVDWVRFDAAADTSYVIKLLNVFGFAEYRIRFRFYDRDASNQIAERTSAGLIDWLCPASGTYYLRVTRYSIYVDETGSYDLRIYADNRNPDVDDYETDDIARLAKPLPVDGAIQRRNIHTPYDVDWVRFDAVADMSYVIELLNVSGFAEYRIRFQFYDRDASNQIAERTSAGLVDWLCPASGTYYLRVTRYSIYVDETGSYDLRIYADNRNPHVDDYETDDEPSLAKPIRVDGSIQSRNIHTPYDVDWVRFDAVADMSYVIELLNVSGFGNYRIRLQLYDRDASNRITERTSAGLIEWLCPASGTYYLRVTRYSVYVDETGTYDVRITGPPQEVQVPDPPTPISPGSGSAPGPIIGTLTPALRWEPVSNAEYYALAISVYPYGADYVIYRNEQIYGTSLTLPTGILAEVQHYRWNMQAYNRAGWSGLSSIMYFQTPASSTQIPASEDISDYADLLSAAYKVPSVIIKAVMEQESNWTQFDGEGNPLVRHEPDGRIGIGLMQITLYPTPTSQTLTLGRIIEGQPEGSNPFTTTTEDVSVDVNRLQIDWRYNLEIGVRLLVAKKVASLGAGDDARILENWYYPLAYYNGAVKGGANDPSKASYNRSVITNDDWKSINAFPYQECVYNIIAQLYSIPSSRRDHFGSGVKVTLPGPIAVRSGAGQYDYVEATFGFWDWVTFYGNGTVLYFRQGGNPEDRTDVRVHRVQFGAVGPPVPLVRPSIDVNTGDLTLSWESTAGRQYQIESSEDLLNWSVEKIVETSADTLSSWQDLGMSTRQRRFYRVLLLTE